MPECDYRLCPCAKEIEKSPGKLWRTCKSPYVLWPSFLSKFTQDHSATGNWPSMQSRSFATFMTCHFLLHIWFLLHETSYFFMHRYLIFILGSLRAPLTPLFPGILFILSQCVLGILACWAFLLLLFCNP